MSKQDVVLVELIKRHGVLFPGERCGFPEATAKRLIADKIACPLDKDGAKIMPPELEEDSDESEADEAENETAVDAKHKFIIDGLPAATAAALVDGGLESPTQVHRFLAAGKKLESLRGIGETTAKKVAELYEDMDEDDLDDGQDEDDGPGLFDDDEDSE